MTEPNRTSPRMHISTIEWEMMDKTKFLPLSMLSSFCVRCTLYPLTLIKTRLQIQKHGEVYKGITLKILLCIGFTKIDKNICVT